MKKVNFVVLLALLIVSLLGSFSSATIYAEDVNAHRQEEVLLEKEIDLKEAVAVRDRGTCGDFKGTYLYDKYCNHPTVPSRGLTAAEWRCLLQIGFSAAAVTPGTAWFRVVFALGAVALGCVK